ncbi:nuclear transport factor 2 family protein [Arachidicoccus ginsenosidimutans]|uniref:DUF4878 domain-containing protein n=1 Tax=Arachidicoccus sp. BS20 TaxID=1850526 RepID=UPI0012E77F8E|nr:DUF4878 domain-containing protein [Arachidicoccus sp. BS20]
MKKTLLCLAIAISCVAFESKSQTATPSSVASSFSKAMVNLNIAEAEKYADSVGVNTLKQIEPMVSQQSAAIPDSIKTLLTNATFTADSEKITGDSAFVEITMDLGKPINGIQQQKQKVALKKENNEWKVIINKFISGDNPDSNDEQ